MLFRSHRALHVDHVIAEERETGAPHTVLGTPTLHAPSLRGNRPRCAPERRLEANSHVDLPATAHDLRDSDAPHLSSDLLVAIIQPGAARRHERGTACHRSCSSAIIVA